MANIIYIDQSAELGGGELNLLDFLRCCPVGASVVLLQDGPFRARLEEAGIAVRVMPLGTSSGVRREGGVLSVLAVAPDLFRMRRQLRHILADADIIYANSQKAFLLAALSRRRRQPLLWHLHDILTANHFSRVLRRIAVGAGNRCATRILVNSKATGSAFVDAGGNGELVRLAYCGLDPKPWQHVRQDAVRLRREIAPNARYLIGVFGRLTRWKGQHVMLEALQSLPEAELLIVGGPLFGEKVYEAELHAQAKRLGITGRVHFLGFRDDVPALMSAVDCVVHSSIAAEPFGRVIVEGMLAGKPVIATAGGGASEIIESGSSGMLVHPSSASALSAAVRRLMEDPEFAERIAASGRGRAETVFSLQSMCDAILQVIREVSTASNS